MRTALLEDELLQTQLLVATLESMTGAGHETMQFFYESGIVVHFGSTNDADADADATD